MNVHILSTAGGCQTNLLDSSRLRARLFASGCRLVADADSADYIVVNTCGFNNAREEESLAAIARHAQRPGKKTVVFGCLPKINRKALRKVFDGPVFGAGEIDSLCEFFGLAAQLPEARGLSAEAHFISSGDAGGGRILRFVCSAFFKIEELSGRRSVLLHNIIKSSVNISSYFNIQVASGCLGECSYCAIKSAKGTLRSVPIEEIMETFRFALANGHRSFRLLGDDMGCWGQDIGLDAAVLLEKLLSAPERFEIVLNYFHPAWFLLLQERLKPLLADPRVTVLNIPLQSGSSKVLGLMNRRYAPGEVTDALRAIKKLNAGLVLKTHLMVGFPFEERSDFIQSLALIDSFDLILPFVYAPRPATKILEQLGGSGRIGAATGNFRLLRMRLNILSRYLSIVLKGMTEFKKHRGGV